MSSSTSPIKSNPISIPILSRKQTGCKTVHKPKQNLSHLSQIKRELKARTVTGRDVVKHAVHSMRLAKELAHSRSIIDSYVKDGKDGKNPLSVAAVSEVDSLKVQLSAMRAAARSAIGGQHIKIKLYYDVTLQSGANTALGNFFPIVPAQSAEWASLITLYDECRVDKLKVKFLGGMTIAPAANPPGGHLIYAVGYDPDYHTAATSTRDIQESQYHKLCAMPFNIGFATPTCPVGLHELDVKIPHTGPVLNEDMKTNPNFPGAWMSCLDTADSVGYLRYYVPAGGSTATTALFVSIELDCEFRIRT